MRQQKIKIILRQLFKFPATLLYLFQRLIKDSREVLNILSYYVLTFRYKKSFSFTNDSCTLVIARYNEDLEWLKKVENPYIIFNKGANNLKDFKNVVRLPNIGKEAHTYLHFIITHYNCLPQKVVFLQGNPFPHSPNLLFDLKLYENFSPIQPLTIRYLPKFHKDLYGSHYYNSGIPNEEKSKSFIIDQKGIKYYVEQIDGSLDTVWPFNHSAGRHEFYIRKFHEKILNYYFDRIGLDAPSKVYMNYAAQFSVNRENILLNSKQFYQNALDVLLENEMNPHIYERLWLSIFRFSFPETR